MLEDTTLPGPLALGSSEGLGPLVACPFCGASKGYTLRDGDTYRWWMVMCAGCGAGVAECRSDSSTKLDAPKPPRWPAADEEWNAAGAYADRLRRFLMAARDQFREYGHEGSARACDAALRA